MTSTSLRLGLWLLIPSLLVTITGAMAQDRAATDNEDAHHLGSLIIGGGGTLPDAIYDRFVQLAGGAAGRLVLIPTASEDLGWLQKPDELVAYIDDWKQEGIPDVSILHTRDRDLANQEEFVAPLRTATAVWFGGGDQALLERAYVGTLVEREVHGIIARGGVVGGSSAGAAIQSRVMIRSGDDQPDIGKGLSLMPGAILDQHFLRRSRVNRLLKAVQRHPDLQGIGIDEGTAILVQGQQWEVLGDSYVMLVEASPDGQLPRIRMLARGDHYPGEVAAEASSP